MTNLDSILKSRDITLPTKVCIVKALVFPVVMYEYESQTIKEAWVPKNWYFWIVLLDKTLESPLDSKEIKPVNPKWNQPWIFIGRTDAEAETLNTLATWCEEPAHWKRPSCWEWLKTEGEGAAKDEMVRESIHRHKSEQTLGESEGQRCLACCSSWGCKESDVT